MATTLTDDYSDLTELGIDVNEEDGLTLKFHKCVKHIQSIAGTIENDTLLKLYGFYKQSLEGPCNIPKPNWYDLKGKAKWEAWKALGNLDPSEAKNNYIELVLTVSPEFSFDEAGNKAESWVRVSSLAQEPSPLEKNICDYIRSGDVKKVTDYLKANDKKDILDESGMGLVHYTCDIGNANILEILLREGSNINLQDSEGQTALHYAASCAHLDCVKLLLDKGAKCDIQDYEGCTPIDVACDDTVRALLKLD